MTSTGHPCSPSLGARLADLRQEQDHRDVKQRIAVMLGFKLFKNAAITIAGIELPHRIRKGQFGLGRLDVQGQPAPEVWNAVLGA